MSVFDQPPRPYSDEDREPLRMFPEDIERERVIATIEALETVKHCGSPEPVTGCDCQRCLIRQMQKDYHARLEAEAHNEVLMQSTEDLRRQLRELEAKAGKLEAKAGKLEAKAGKLRDVLEYHFEEGELELHGDNCPDDEESCQCPAKEAFNDAMRDD